MPAPVRSSSPPRATPARRIPGKGTQKSIPARASQVLVAVDKALVRHGLVRLLETSGKPFDIHVSAHARSTRECVRETPFDLLLIDPAQVREIGAALHVSPCKTVLVTARDHVGMAPLPGRMTACGMLSESDTETSARKLLLTVAGCTLACFERDRCGGCLVQRTWQQAHLPLSPREREVFLHIGAGAGPAKIARDLGLSVKTVESHREKIKHKLGLDSAAALQCAALRWRQGYALTGGD